MREESYIIICSANVFLYFRTLVIILKYNWTANFNFYGIFYFILRAECVSEFSCSRNEILLELRCFRFIINFNLSLAHQDRQPNDNKRNDSLHKIIELEV